MQQTAWATARRVVVAPEILKLEHLLGIGLRGRDGVRDVGIGIPSLCLPKKVCARPEDSRIPDAESAALENILRGQASDLLSSLPLDRGVCPNSDRTTALKQTQYPSRGRGYPPAMSKKYTRGQRKRFSS